MSDGKTRSFSVPSAEEGINFNAYYSILGKLYGLFQPLMKQGFISNLPKTLVCILSGRQDCGPQAELVKTVSLELGQPLLTFLLSLRSQTCTPPTTDGESSSFFWTYLRMGDTGTPLSGFQQTFIDMLLSVSGSESVMGTVRGLLDTAVTHLLKVMAKVLQVPMDYVRLALQFGIKVPSLDEEQTCVQGDLKQLIMWGIKHNLTWSLNMALVDIVLENVLPSEQSSYPGPECQSPPSFRSGPEPAASSHTSHQFSCDHRDLAPLNDTLCAEILASGGSGSAASLLPLCRALGSLSLTQLQQVWRNACYLLQALAAPLVARSPDCSVGDTWPPPVIPPEHQSPPAGSTSEHHRVSREAWSLRQLACDYSSWLQSSELDAGLVSLCSDNDRLEFGRRVCNNSTLMRRLLSEQSNSWLYGYCANSSAGPEPVVDQFCRYEQWLDQPGVTVQPALLELCMTFDSPKLTKLICEHTGLLMLLMSNPDNWRFMPNCTTLGPPTPFPGPPGPSQLESCRYSEWRDATLITTDLLSKCIRFDQSSFTREVCSNTTFLHSLLLNKDHAWLEMHCNTSLKLPTPEPSQAFSQAFSLAAWCNYSMWGEQVDESVVGLCWQHDQDAFRENVCCKAPVLEKLLEHPHNQWLTSVCSNAEEITVTPQLCRYSEWTRPIIVDMTELALCAELDPLNFTSIVCSHDTIIQNLLANQDNVWLTQHCANHSGISPDAGGGHDGDGTVVDPAEQCHYSSWSISPPDVALLTLCWEHDQANFVSSICPNSGLLLVLSREPSSAWVSSMCTTYTNSTTPGPVSCVSKNVMEQFGWICPTYFASACKPCATQNMVLQMIARCWVENLRSRAEDMLTAPVAAMLDRAVSTTVLVVLTVEDVQGSLWHVKDTVRQSVLKSVVDFFEREKNPEPKRVLLQCFGTVLSSLLQTTREVTGDELLLIKEYYSLPLSSLRPVLAAAHISTVRLILQYYSRIKNTLQVSDQYLSTMVSVLLQTHLAVDDKLFPELAPLLVAARPADIQSLPSLQSNVNARETINRNLNGMSLDQREAFGLWYSKVLSPSNITRGHQSLIRDTGNLIAYLPFQSFQHLSPAQLLDGLDLLQRNTLPSLKQEFVACSIIGTHKNLTAQDFIRLGNLSCLADPADLLAYRNSEAFGVIQDSAMNCMRSGLSMPSQLVSSLLLNSSELQVPSSLSADRLTELAPLLPSLGITFLQGLTASQLHAVLPALSSISFTSEQASIIVEKLFSSNTLVPAQLQELGSLIVGVKTETLLSLTSDILLSSLRGITQYTEGPPYRRGLCPPVAIAITTKLWGFPEVVNWLNDVEPLLSCTPLLSVLPRTRLLVDKLSNTSTKQWNTQQAIAIFKKLLEANPNQIQQHFLNLGTLGQGVTCKVLQEHFRADPSPSSVRKILAFLRQQPGLLHTSLKKCLVEELYQFEFFPELLGDLGVEIALSMPVSTIKKFSADVMDTLRGMIVEDPRHFLMLSRTKQELLVDKIVQRMGMYTGLFTEEEFRSLGIMAPFVVDEVFIQVDRGFFSKNLEFLKELCYSSRKMEIMARILLDPAVLGPVETWNQTTLSQVGRLLFFLPVDILQQIPMELMSVGRIEKLFMSHREWERGDVGALCADGNDRKTAFEKQQYVLQFFLGFLRMYPQSPTPMVPTCEVLQTTSPSAWTSNSLTSMSPSAFSNCLELMGHDPFLASYQRSAVLSRVKKMYGPVSSFSQSLIAQLGRIATELSPEELSALPLTERRSIGAMGAVSTWSNRQLAALFTSVLNSTKQNPSQLDSSTLVALGYIVCGAKTTEIMSFNNVEFSKAVLWLGQLRLSCSEEQLLALVGLLSHSLAFGPMSSWGTDVFAEVGVLAAGLPDMAMSALVKEQIEGITPMAISMIPPEKLAVTFHQRQINMFSYEQAAAVTQQQLLALSDVQRTALAMVLTPWENRPVDFRGRSPGLMLSHSPLCLSLGLLILLAILSCSDT
ncbi:stereocilin [Cololabis saira]|uniref:stereocilin n=1 Tax=Cololabis saira TaxID=129043 RepID=UPI002AD2B501|nr:stereocilin [Cololabis saira]